MTRAGLLAAERAAAPIPRRIGVVQRKCASCGGRGAGPCAKCAGDPAFDLSSPLDRRPTGEAVEAPAIVQEALRSPGQPLDQASRAFFEPRFGHDFSGVRVRTGAAAGASAAAIDAATYTVGADIVFNAGRYEPGSAAGRRLIAHELAHVVQQRTSPSALPLTKGLAVGSACDPLEKEADFAAERIMGAAEPIILTSRASPAVQRAPAADAAPDGPPAKGRCGPDATQWFVTRANQEMNDRQVLSVKDHLTEAARLAPWFDTTAGELGEAGTTAVVLAKEALLGDRAPVRTATAQAHIGEGSQALPTAAAVAAKTANGNIFDAAIGGKLAYHMLRAAMAWKELVTHGTRYDFKKTDLKHAAAGGCPDPSCDTGEYGSVTICPTKTGGNCYETDAPGNIFYSMVGKYIGWTELTIKLGSQLAELLDDKRTAIGWDTDKDVNALTAGYALTLPLSRSELCGKIPNFPKLNRWSHCRDCDAPFSTKGAEK